MRQTTPGPQTGSGQSEITHQRPTVADEIAEAFKTYCSCKHVHPLDAEMAVAIFTAFAAGYDAARRLGKNELATLQVATSHLERAQMSRKNPRTDRRPGAKALR